MQAPSLSQNTALDFDPPFTGSLGPRLYDSLDGEKAWKEQ